MPNCQMVYQHGSGKREVYLGYAEDTARLTLPTLAPKGQLILTRPTTVRGTLAARSLTSSVMKTIWPPGVMWARLDFPQKVWAVIKAKYPQFEGFIRQRLEQRTRDVHDSLANKGARARTVSAVRRLLIEGAIACVNLPDKIRFYPLRSHCEEREQGEVRWLCLHDQITPNPVYSETKEGMNGKQDLYTLVDYVRGEVWRQTDKEAAQRVDEETSRQYFVMVGEIPDVDDYPTSYFYNFLRLIAKLDHSEASLDEAMATAAHNPVGIRPGTSLAKNPKEYTEKPSGAAVLMNEGDVHFPDKRNKLGDWAFVAQIQSQDTEELAQVAAQGIKDRAMGEESATKTLTIIDEISAQTSDLFEAIEESFQRPLFLSEVALLEEVDPLFPELPVGLADVAQVVVTSGVNALEKRRAMEKFIRDVLPVLKGLDQYFVVDAKVVADKATEGIQQDVRGMYSRQDPQQVMLQQLQMMRQQAALQGPTSNGKPAPRDEMLMTAGGPQPPQPYQPPPPSP